MLLTSFFCELLHANEYLSSHSNQFSSILEISTNQQYLTTGTTVVGLCCVDGVVLGADTRSTGGVLVMDKTKLKIHKISDRVYACAAGTSADCDQITRKASHMASLFRIEREVAGDYISLDPITLVLKSIINSIQKPDNIERKPQSVLIVGGIDSDYSSTLFQINMDGFPIHTSYASLGSGSADALAVLESERHKWSDGQSNPIDKSFQENIAVSNGIDVVRKAVRAGILNDLGSGSYIDLCVITKDKVTKWRELVVKEDKLFHNDNDWSSLGSNETNNHELDSLQAIYNNSDNNNNSFDLSSLGTKVFCKSRLGRTIVNGKIVEKLQTKPVIHDLSQNIEFLSIE
eukprot:gene4393-6213_t